MADTADPKALRALAHPIRWRLIDVLLSEGTATVTRCSRLLGESTATCSYHLTILAKYGFIARAAGTGKERPWRLASTDLELRPSGPASAAAGALLDNEFARLKASIDRTGDHSTKIMAATAWLTPRQAEQAAAEIRQTLDKYGGQGRDVADRPAEAREIRLFASISLA
ncbi:MAG TPA: winged helix-turn-helix domain-containing protein [Streptosporangiaceae bacterium]|nr:winged helix-turn-helix domain-containing protein [Streptosporangiaceae bacterium]